MKLAAKTILNVIAVFALFQLALLKNASAQSDPSIMSLSGPASAGFKGKPGEIPPADESLEGHRYVKKHKAPLKKTRQPASEEETTGTGGPGPETDLQNAQVAPLPRLSGENYSPQTVPQPAASLPEQTNSTFGNRMRDIILGGDPEMIDQYRSFLDAGDIRKNVFEFTLATTYMYDTSMSPYFFRNYIDSSPGAFVGLDLWLTPFLGIDADYRGTFLDTIKDSPTQDIYVSGSQTWFDLGIHFRRFFGMALNSSSLTFGIRYADYVFAVPPSAQNRFKIHTQAPELTIDAAIPSSRYFSWTMGLSLQPFVSQTEIIGSSDLRSGQSSQTVELGANFGGEYRMSRQTRAFFKLSTQVYKSQFSGTSNGVDPTNGASPTNVPVNNVFYMFDIGVKLGR